MLGYSFNEVYSKADALSLAALSTCEQACAHELGIDQKAFWIAHVGEDFIALPRAEVTQLEAHSDWGSIPSCFRQELGMFMFFSAEAPQVAEALSIFRSH